MTGEFGMTLLLNAAAFSWPLEVVRILVEKPIEADLNFGASGGNTPLYLAVETGNVELVVSPFI